MKLRFACAFAAVLAWGATAQAQTEEGFAIDRFDPAEHGSNWFSGESLDLRGHLRPTLGLTLDWAYKPLVLYDADGDEAAAIVESQLFAHLGGGIILWDRVRFAANLPIALISRGESATLAGTTFAAADGASLGDLRLGADVRLLGVHGDAVRLAAGLQLHLPTGDRENYTGDGGVRLVPRFMLAGDIAAFAYSARLGLNYRSQDEGLGNVDTGSELTFVGTAGLRFVDRKLLVGPELWGSTVFSDAFAKATTPFELIFGAHYTLNDFILALGFGPGLTRGLGSPGMRILASIEWSPAIEEEKPAPEPEPEPEDRDGDGIIDDEDACPDQKGVRSDDPQKHGCPSDRDRDGIVDDEDACPDEAGAPNRDPEKHGCPSDRDGDGILDAEDACPSVPGVRSDNPQKHGCPGDRDKDTIIDPEDACPDTAGPKNADPKKHGCPAARVEKGQIKIIERIEFKTNSAEIVAESFEIMEAVRKILVEHDEITRISVEGHTDNVGKPEYNKKLSQRRAEAVVAWLAKKGVAKQRLQAKGFGMERPIADNDDAEGRQTNRRVEFHIETADGAPVQGVSDADGDELGGE